MKAQCFLLPEKASRLGLKRGWAGLGWGLRDIIVTLIRDVGVALREQRYHHIFPQHEARPDAIAAIGVAISATITSAHNVLTHAGEIMPENS